MLLAVAFIAVGLGIWRADLAKQNQARLNRIHDLKSALAGYEQRKVQYEEMMQTGNLQTQSETARQLKSINSIIATTKQMIAQQSD